MLDCLVVDEAHRLTEKSGYHSNLGENQVKEIINASRFSIFFLDENQKVTLKDIGSEELIKNMPMNLVQEWKHMNLIANLDVMALMVMSLGLTMF